MARFGSRTKIGLLVFTLRIAREHCGGYLCVVLFAISVLTAVCCTGRVYVHRWVIDTIAESVSGIGGGQVYQLGICLGSEFGVTACNQILAAAGSFITYVMSRRLAMGMKSSILLKTRDIDYSFFDNAEWYDRLTRAEAECSGRPVVMLGRVTSAATNIATSFSLGVVVFSFSPMLAGMGVLVCIPVFFMEMRIGKIRYELEYQRTQKMRESSYAAHLLVDKNNAAETASFGLWEHLFGKWRKAANLFYRQDIGIKRKDDCQRVVTGLISQLSVVGATGYIVFLCISGKARLSIGEVVMYSTAFSTALVSFRSALQSIANMHEDALFIKNYHDFEIENTAQKQTGTMAVPEEIESIEFVDVWFRYEGAESWVLRNLSVKFVRGENCLLLGANGAGKSTMFKLLIRLYDPSEGRILLNGIDLREYRLMELREKIWMLFQRYVPYAFTAGENIGCGKLGEMGQMSLVIDAARRANAHEFIAGLSEGYETMLSRVFERGHELSWGQWQRICLARLFMKDAGVVVFDEPTASIDIETQTYLLREITALSRKKICIFSSHHSLELRMADRIVVVKDGAVVEDGGYEHLLSKNGEFARLRSLFKGTCSVAAGE